MTTQENTLKKHLTIIKTISAGKDVRYERVMLLERSALLLLCFGMILTPGLWVRHFGGFWGRKSRKLWVEVYALTKVAIVGTILYAHWWNVPCVYILCLWLLADVFISLAGYIFLRHFWQNPYSWNRSLLLLFINFVEYTSWFACIYLHKEFLKLGDSVVAAASDALYFSIVTAATVGYGDIVPASESARVFVTIEILASLFFVVTVASYFVSNMATPEVDKKP